MDTLPSFDVLVDLKHSDGFDDGSERNRMLANVVFWHDSFATKDCKQIRNVALQIRQLLGHTETRFEGLSLLSLLVQQSSFPVFVEHYQCWFQELRHFIKNDSSNEICFLSVKIFAEIVRCGSDHPDSVRWLGINAPPCIPQMVDLSEKHDMSVAVGLDALMKHLPGSCRTSLGKIYRRLLKMLLSADECVVDASARLLSRVPFTSAAGEGGKGHAEAWLLLYNKLCATLHASLDELYEGLELDRHDASKLGDILEFPSRSATLCELNATDCFLSQYRIAFAACKCLKNLLDADASTSLTVPVEATLLVLCRILKITGTTIVAKNIRDSRLILLYSVLPVLHAEAFGLLKNLIVSCTSHLLVHDATIQNLVLRTLQWTSSVRTKDNLKHSLGKLRGHACQVLSTWMSVSGGSADMTVHGNGIVEQLLKDVAIDESTVNLNQKVAEDRNTKKPPKAKRQRMDPNFTNATRQNTKESVDSETCIEALNALRVILFSNGDDLLAKTHRAIHHTTTTTLKSVQRSPKDALLYADPACREALYAMVHAAILNDPYVNISQLSTAIHLMSLGKLDSCTDVKQRCMEALATCRLMIHPARRNFQSSRVVANMPEETMIQSEAIDVTESLAVHEQSENFPNFLSGFSPASPQIIHHASVIRDTKDYTPAVNVNVNGHDEMEEDENDTTKMKMHKNVSEPSGNNYEINDDIVLVSEEDEDYSVNVKPPLTTADKLELLPLLSNGSPDGPEKPLQQQPVPSVTEEIQQVPAKGVSAPVDIECVDSSAGQLVLQLNCNGGGLSTSGKDKNAGQEQPSAVTPTAERLSSVGDSKVTGQSLDSMLSCFVADLPDEMDVVG